MPTEEQIRQWVRDEQAKLTNEKQEACNHAFSGTLRADATVACDQCEKILTLDNVHFEVGDALSPVERRHIANKER